METLRIKCPSCGIILEVKNSKNEAVKRITCPHCKKQLAVTFADVLYSQDGIELKVVRVADGGDKYILRVVNSDKEVALNGEVLRQGDEVVLIHGDKVRIGQSELVFNSGKLVPIMSVPNPQKEETRKPDKGTLPKPDKRSSRLAWILLAIFIVGGILAWYFIKPSSPKKQEIKDTDSIAVVLDTVSHKSAVKHTKTKKSEKTSKKEVREKTPEKIDVQSDDNDDFSLEVQATKGDVQAQYKLGMRWVTSNDCTNVLKGVKYLESAARKGHSGAQYALGVVYEKGSPACGINRNPSLARQYMQQAAENGNAKAIKYLNSNIE